ncbi:MAG: DUF3638 domain-containing protein [Chlamydiae bacterium]|nr:DUF3638 domain-containing protein [Chlamydiota bacterium]
MAKRREKLKKQALMLVEKLPQDSKGATLARLQRLSGKEKVLTMEDLMGLFVLGQNDGYLVNTYLKSQEVEELDLVVGQYLQETVLHTQAEESLALYHQMLKATTKEDRGYFKAKLHQVLKEKPHYEPSEHREYLVFEAVTGMRLKAKQVQKLSHITNEERVSKVIHMIMGAGKSKVITPIWALLQAKRGVLPIIVVPDALYQTGKEDTKMTVYKSFGKFAHAFEFERNSDFSKEKLQAITANLEEYKKEKGFIYTTRESLLSFFLKAQELFYQYEETQGVQAKKELEESVNLAWGILKELREGCVGLLDEAHSLLNSREELNYTFGLSKGLKKEEVESLHKMLLFLVTDPKMKAVIDLQNNNQAKMSHETYEEEVKPLLVDRLSKEFKVPKEYFYDSLDRVPQQVAAHKDRNLIAIGKVLVTTFLPHTLTRKANEHYGLSSSVPYCIPYVGNNTPNEKAEFASHLETLLYTGYYYLQQGLSEKNIRDFKELCKQQAKREQIVEKCVFEATKGVKLFREITGLDLSDKDIDFAAAKVYMKQHPEKLLVYCQEVVVPEIKIFPKKLSANPHHLAALFKEVHGMTGTPWNKDAYPSRFHTEEEKEIERYSINILRKVDPQEIVTMQAASDQETMQEIIEVFGKTPTCRAVIDAGALVKNISNEAFAKALLDKADPQAIDGVAYYDKHNELKILERASGQSVLFKDSSIPKERRVTFYDELHKIGADIAQKNDAKALVTVSETVKKSELFQAIWRMREIDKGQTLSFLVPKKVVQLMTKKAEVTTEDILRFATANQKEQEMLDNFRARKLEIRAIVEGAVHKALIYAKNFKERYTIFQKTRELLMQPVEVAAFEAFGGIEKEEQAEVILKEYTQKWLQVLEELGKKGAIKNLSKYKDRILNLKPIPLNPTYRKNENTAIDTQIENQVEKQVKLTVATEADEQREDMEPWKLWPWAQDLDIFNEDWLQPQQLQSNWFGKETNNPRVPPLYRAQEVLEQAKNPHVKVMKGLFDDHFLVSNNFVQQKVKNNKETKAEPFAWYAKPVYHLLVAEEEDGTITTMMIDQKEVPFFREKFQEDEGFGKRKLCIYNPTIGIVLQGAKEFDEEKLKDNPAFIQHVMYAKFWDGASTYTEREAQALETWISQQGVQKCFTFFEQIIRNKKDSAKRFEDSNLKAVFVKLLKEEASQKTAAG